MSEDRFCIALQSRAGYQFAVDFGQEGVPDLVVDEPAPLGNSAGPNATRLLAAAIGNCMSASLLFCLRKARVEIDRLHTQVTGTLVRNEQGRLRVGSLRVEIHLEGAAEQLERARRCLPLFEDFCTVGQSVRAGIPLHVEIGTSARGDMG